MSCTLLSHEVCLTVNKLVWHLTKLSHQHTLQTAMRLETDYENSLHLILCLVDGREQASTSKILHYKAKHAFGTLHTFLHLSLAVFIAQNIFFPSHFLQKL